MSPMSWFDGEYVYNLTNNEIEDSVHILLALISQGLFVDLTAMDLCISIKQCGGWFSSSQCPQMLKETNPDILVHRGIVIIMFADKKILVAFAK